LLKKEILKQEKKEEKGEKREEGEERGRCVCAKRWDL
jgi:hypothetical protein